MTLSQLNFLEKAFSPNDSYIESNILLKKVIRY